MLTFLQLPAFSSKPLPGRGCHHQLWIGLLHPVFLSFYILICGHEMPDSWRQTQVNVTIKPIPPINPHTGTSVAHSNSVSWDIGRTATLDGIFSPACFDLNTHFAVEVTIQSGRFLKVGCDLNDVKGYLILIWQNSCWLRHLNCLCWPFLHCCLWKSYLFTICKTNS